MTAKSGGGAAVATCSDDDRSLLLTSGASQPKVVGEIANLACVAILI